MSYLLDTVTVSELTKSLPVAAVIEWLDVHEQEGFYLSVITLGEIQKGIEKLPDSTRRRSIEEWLARDLAARFEARILAINTAIALAWGEICGRAARDGEPVPVIDALIASTARVHDLTVVTRNVRDLTRYHARVINPWP